MSDEEVARQLIKDIGNSDFKQAGEKALQLEEVKLQAELQRIDTLVGSHVNLLSGAVGQVLSNYTDRLIDEVGRKYLSEDKEFTPGTDYR